jgi:Uncharacterized conserved protein
LTLVQIDNYGPWTVTPEPRREMDLQTLQSRLFADVAQFIGSRGGYVFFTRFDNMIAVTNGIDRPAHATLQETIGNRYPVTISLGVDVADTPAAALDGATERLQAAGSAQDEERTEVLAGTFLDPSETGPEPVHIAHFDVNDATGKYTDQLNEFDSFIHIERSYASLMEYLRTAHGGLSFFAAATTSSRSFPNSQRGPIRTLSTTSPRMLVSISRSVSAADKRPTRPESPPNTPSKTAATRGRPSSSHSPTFRPATTKIHTLT